MPLSLDVTFVKALRSREGLISRLPAGDVFNTSIDVPEDQLPNVPLPYVIVTYDGLHTDATSKDSGYSAGFDVVDIGVEVAAKSRAELAEIAEEIRDSVRSYMELHSGEEDVPNACYFSAGGVQYDSYKPCYWQVLKFNCDI